MTFFLSTGSRDRLAGIDGRLAKVVCRAIELTTVDFGVIQGRRSVEEQRVLVEKGASQTMQSKHLDGLAVDLMAYLGGRGSWELNLYDEIAEAMRDAAREKNVPIRWGGAWTVPDIRYWNFSMEDAMNSYVDSCRAKGKRPFIDAPHFETV
jgi:peptidoglycan L-alanyl-D-glutamate endopeptidase CwlK